MGCTASCLKAFSTLLLTFLWLLKWTVLLNVSLPLRLPISPREMPFLISLSEDLVQGHFAVRVTLPLPRVWLTYCFVPHCTVYRGGGQHSWHCFASFFLSLSLLYRLLPQIRLWNGLRKNTIPRSLEFLETVCCQRKLFSCRTREFLFRWNQTDLSGMAKQI